MEPLKTGDLFPAEVVKEIYNKVQGRSTLAKLSGQTPIPFSGIQQYVFDLEGNAQIVGEGEKKLAGKAKVTSKVIKPVKFVYQARVTDEFVKTSRERQLNFLSSFVDGFSKKISEAFDIAAIHGLEPRSLTNATFKDKNSFDGLVTGNVLTYNAETIDDQIDEAATMIATTGGDITGIAFSRQAGAALGKLKDKNGVHRYPEFRFAQNPDAFHGIRSDVNRTLMITGEDAKKDHVILGDFVRAFKWGYTENIPLEIIEYGNPDGGDSDLKETNQVLLRAESYIGWGILLPESFVRVQEA